jgi:hypothetical protein
MGVGARGLHDAVRRWVFSVCAGSVILASEICFCCFGCLQRRFLVPKCFWFFSCCFSTGGTVCVVHLSLCFGLLLYVLVGALVCISCASFGLCVHLVLYCAYE